MSSRLATGPPGMETSATEPRDIARRVIDDNHFMVLGTTAAQVPDAELAPAVDAAFSSVRPGARAYGVEELSGATGHTA
ncbi:hypothetical protein [Promicromonospora iranensis]|uniref:Uncharacterized protein n=1 Tax=Promicromonospora iranensis TaxID=1105144 RepID=A0ABU2CT21_9MICO|nr:hypothetical protein [Promicromonospora iranensis]MDR7384302.1 hypothetical protein [Promicromonospora iranensis]